METYQPKSQPPTGLSGPGKVLWKETIRPKNLRRDQKELPPAIAPASVRVADATRAAAGLLVHLLVSKCADDLPFSRL